MSQHIIAIEYSVPVLCWIDVEEGTITKVTMHGESIEPTGNLVDEDANYFDDPKAFEVAQQIADSADWPAWEQGY